MRLALTIAEMAVGGAERVVVQLARDAVRRGDDVTLAAAPGPLDEELGGLALRRELLPVGAATPLGAGAGTWPLARVLRRRAPHVVHAHNARATGRAAAARALAGRRSASGLLATFHGVPPAGDPIAARLLRGADHVACVSRELADRLVARGLPAQRLSVVHNAVAQAPDPSAARRAELDDELGLGGGGPVVAVVGRLVEQKRHDRLLEAVRLVVRRHPQLRVLVVGAGPLRGAVEARVAELGLEAVVRLTGLRLDARELIARADLLVFSSDSEGLSIAALEALAAGTPVVSTDVAGMRELLASGAGEMIAGHDAGALAQAIGALLDDDGARAAMGARGRELVATDFSEAAMLAAYRAAYERLAARA